MSSFIGNQPATSFDTVRKQVSTSNSGTTITLDYPVTSVADIRLTINAVLQSYDNYSVSGSTLTVGGTLNNDRVEILFVGRTYGSIAPSDASIVTSALQDDAVTTAKINDGAVTNVKLGTDINATKLTAGLVPTARLGSGTASSSTVLYGDQTYKTAPSGGLTLIASGTGSSVSNLNLDSKFTNSYKAYKFVGGFRPATDGSDLWFLMRTGGSNTSGSSYRYIVKGFIAESGQSSDARQYGWGTTYFKVSTNGCSNNSSHMQYVDMNFWNPMAASTTFGADNPFISGHSTLYAGSAATVHSNFACMYNGSANYDGLHITWSSGDINAYNYQLYGYNPS